MKETFDMASLDHYRSRLNLVRKKCQQLSTRKGPHRITMINSQSIQIKNREKRKTQVVLFSFFCIRNAIIMNIPQLASKAKPSSSSKSPIQGQNHQDPLQKCCCCDVVVVDVVVTAIFVGDDENDGDHPLCRRRRRLRRCFLFHHFSEQDWQSLKY